MKKILFLLSSRSRSSKVINKRINQYEELSDGKIKIVKSFSDDIKIVIDESEEQKVKVEIGGVDMLSYHLAYFKNWQRNCDVVAVLAYIFEQNKKKFFDDILRNNRYGNKLLPSVFAVVNNIPVPKTVFLSRELISQNINFLEKFLKSPFIMKSLTSAFGKRVFLIRDTKQIANYLKQFPEDSFIFQEYIENKYTLRVVTMDYKVNSAEFRTVKLTSKGDFSNHGGGVDVEEKPISIDLLPKEIILAAEKIAKFKKVNIAGLDFLIEEKGNKAYFIEINSAPGLNPATDQGQNFVKFLVKSCL